MRPPAGWRRLTARLVGLLALAGAGAAPLTAQVKNIRFERLTGEDGLSQNDVYDIYQDRRGFMWFATQDGLNRWDGYSFTAFRHDPLTPGTLSDSFVYTVLEDRRGTLWAGTVGGGLNRYDPQSGTFTALRHDPSNPNSLSNDRIRVLLEDREGLIWIATDGGGLNRFDPASGDFTRFTHNPAEADSLSHDKIIALYQDRSGSLWVGTDGGGLDRFDASTQSFEHFLQDAERPGRLPASRVRAIFEDQAGLLWLGTYEDGLYRLDPARESFKRFGHRPQDPSSLSSNRVRAIFQDDQGTLWVGTDDGLNEWRGEGAGFAIYRNDPGRATSLSENRILSIFQDRGGVLWIGTQGGGTSRWNPHAGFFSAYQANPAEPGGLSSNVVAAFAEDVDGALLVGTYGGGLNRLDRERRTFTHFREDAQDPGSLSDDRVMSLLVDGQGTVWAGTLAGGLNKLVLGAAGFEHYRHDPADPNSLSSDGVTTLLEGSDGFLWIGTFQGGLNRFDREAEKFVHYRHDPDNPTSLAGDLVTALWESTSGDLWVGTESGGLSRLDRDSGSFTHYGHVPGKMVSLSSNTIYTIREDREGVMWIGTQRGLNRWDPGPRAAHQGIFKRYTEREGLPNNAVFGIVEDDLGYLWLSTNNGLSRFDPRTEIFKNFDTAHGLQSNEFNSGAYLRHSSGELYFGGNRGFNFFRPEQIGNNTHVPPVVLTSFLKLNRPVELDPLAADQPIELHYRDYVVTFEFAALDYTAPESNLYAYKLEGFDPDWIEVAGVRRATYTNLDPGNYVFRVRGGNNDGVWNEDGLAVNIRVIPPPWKTWWAYTLYSLAVVLALIAYTRAQQQKLEREAEYSRKLEREVHARTRELAEKNTVLEQVNRKLEEASVTDSLTGLRNRRFLLRNIAGDVAVVERYYAQRPAAVGTAPVAGSELTPDLLFLIFDLDGFKEVNDTYGHAAGDLVLMQVRDLLRQACRESDTLVRWGGDEFLVVGRSTEPRMAEGLAERIRDAVAAHSFDLGDGRQAELSCSLGFAALPFVPRRPELLTWEQVVGIADRALYLAKGRGRNHWFGLLGTPRAAKLQPSELLRRINEAPEQLAAEGIVEIQSSEERARAAAGA